MTELAAALGVSAGGWALLAVGAFLVGFAKTGINGVLTLSVVLFALILPTRESTGVLLVLLLVGDVLAVFSYRHAADWALIRRLLVPVILGVAAGAVFLAWAPGGLLKPVIGAIVVVMVAIQVGRRWRPGSDAASAPGSPGDRPARSGAALGFGGLGGFTTMVANAGGPVMSLYLLRSRLDVIRFVGTLAWFFACVNVVKLPISIGLGLVRPQRLWLCLSLAPAVVLGALLGRWVIRRIAQGPFEVAVLAASGLSGLYLLLS